MSPIDHITMHGPFSPMTDTYPIAAQTDASTQVPIAIGDIQGCHSALRRLLSKLDADPSMANSPLWFAGDLVNRGRESAATLRTLMELGNRATCVLGNHDLHLLGVAAGVRKQKPGDTLDSVLGAADVNDMLEWLRHRPLAHFDGARLLVHAGVLPQWDIATVLELSAEIEVQLRGPSWKTFLTKVFASRIEDWSPQLKGIERARAALNVLTRIRLCNAAGEMELHYTGPPADAPAGFLPWFEIPDRNLRSTLVVFGHWAALGLLLRDTVCGLDTGCVWGNQLTALRLATDSAQRACVQVDCIECKKASVNHPS